VEVCALVPTARHAVVALGAGAARVYAMSDALAEGEWPAGVVPVLDEICREPDHARLDRWVRPGEPVAVGNVSELALAAERGAAAELRSCIPVHNAWALDFLADAGARVVWLSPEVALDEIPPVAAHAAALGMSVGMQVFGPVRVMTSEHCVLQTAARCAKTREGATTGARAGSATGARADAAVAAGVEAEAASGIAIGARAGAASEIAAEVATAAGACASCGMRRRNTALKSIDSDLLPVRTDAHGRSRIYHSAPLDLAPEIGPLIAAGVSRLLVDATFLDPDALTAEIARVHKAVARARAGQPPLSRRSDATSALLHPGIL